MTEEKGVIIYPAWLGMCFGVADSIDIAVDITQKNKEGKVWLLNELVHNPNVNKSFEQKGVKNLGGISNTTLDDRIKKGDTVIIGAYGTDKKIVQLLNENNIRAESTICPLVVAALTKAQHLMDNDYTLIIVGNPNHEEIKYLASELVTPKQNRQVYVCRDCTDLAKIPKIQGSKIGVISQTTYSQKAVDDIINELNILYGSEKVRYENTRCGATIKNQNALQNILTKVEAVVVVGGKHSSNTTKLYQIAEAYFVETRRHGHVKHIETDDELEADWFSNKRIIGLTAGASTPDQDVDKVEQTIAKYLQQHYGQVEVHGKEQARHFRKKERQNPT